MAVFGEATPELICAHCQNTVAGCNASGCGGRRFPGWRNADDVPPF